VGDSGDHRTDGGRKICSETWSYEAAFLIAATLALVAAVAIATVRPPPPT
jgi:hypothetical protein